MISKYFERKTRRVEDDHGTPYGVKFWTLADNRPEWLHDAVYEAHQSDLPNDWIYEICKSACDAIDDESLTDSDSVHEFADSHVDVYTRDLYQWAADMCNSTTFANAEDRARDFGEPSDTEKRLQLIQYCAIEYIAQCMLSAWDENKAED